MHTLEEGLAELPLALSATQQQRLLAYLELLNKWNRVYNLSALRQLEEAIPYHLLDSLSALPTIDGGALPLSLLDVGSGGGQPGIPLAIARPDWSITLLDSNHKKSSFLQQAVIELKLANVNVVRARVEHYQHESYAWIVTRAVASLAKIVHLSRHLLAFDGRWLVYKGTYPSQELVDLPKDIRCIQVVPLRLPISRAERHLVCLGFR